MNTEEIEKYYNYTLPFYKNLWYRREGSYGIHYGLWNKETENLKQALVNINKFMADKAEISSEDKILDAGCGVGGSSIWLAKNYGCKVIGITVSKDQVKEAKRLSQKEGVEDLVDFQLGDFTKMDFSDESFDVVWAIESICYAKEKINFLKEAYRLLKEKGKLIIADGFLAREPRSKKENRILKDFCEGFALKNLEYFDRFKNNFEKVGFRNVEALDKTKQIMPTSRIMYKMSLVAYPISVLTEKLRITPPILTKNAITGLGQYRAFKGRLFNYGIFYGEKNVLE